MLKPQAIPIRPTRVKTLEAVGWRRSVMEPHLLNLRTSELLDWCYLPTLYRHCNTDMASHVSPKH